MKHSQATSGRPRILRAPVAWGVLTNNPFLRHSKWQTERATWLGLGSGWSSHLAHRSKICEIAM